MNITCDSCGGRFKLTEQQIPAGKTASFKCPRCKARITVKSPEQTVDDTQSNDDDFFAFDEEESDGYDASEKPFDFVEEEGKTALLCEPDDAVRKKIIPVLDVLEYHITEAGDSRDALKKMRYHSYDQIIVNEHFDTKNPDANGVLIFLERLHMTVRRNIFVTMISRRYRTMDNMAAFKNSVNIIVNVDNIDDFDKILRRGMADEGLFYQVFKETVR